ncbi:hypothetical protein A3L01_01970 [Thermococcus barossii]|uniref:Uncharacterized protein n=1 Tax=Thermococcus barossii TaxID=54077 RepID=A0A2Z2MK51_9EURY|nr:hypothetical protein A3L01_01970 [Thermococcus barossii]
MNESSIKVLTLLDAQSRANLRNAEIFHNLGVKSGHSHRYTLMAAHPGFKALIALYPIQKTDQILSLFRPNMTGSLLKL